MKNLRVFLLTASFAAVGCVAGEIEPGDKGSVDETVLDEGVEASIEGDVASVAIPFASPLPNITPAQFTGEVRDAVSLVVRNDSTGVTADLTGGTAVEGTPDAPGEFTWELSDDRMSATVRFFNETVTGQSMQPGISYTGTLAVSVNDYIDRIPATEFTIIAE